MITKEQAKQYINILSGVNPALLQINPIFLKEASVSMTQEIDATKHTIDEVKNLKLQSKAYDLLFQYVITLAEVNQLNKKIQGTKMVQNGSQRDSFLKKNGYSKGK